MVADTTAQDALITLLVACSFKGAFFLLIVAWVAFSSHSASRRHFVWTLGMVVMVAMLFAEAWTPQWMVLPALQSLPEWCGWMWEHSDWVLLIWGMGVALGVSRMVIGMASLKRLEHDAAPVLDQEWNARLSECREKMGLKAPVRLLMHPGQIMPMTWGLMRHFIVLPTTAWRWSGNRGRAVLMHELAHIRRRDFFARVIRDLATSVFWFHPLVWLASREMEEDREEASDDAVLASGHQPIAYAEHLAAVATHHPNVCPSLAFARRPLIQRVRNILNPWKSRHPLMPGDRFRVAIFLFLMGGIALSLGFRAPSKSIALTGEQRQAVEGSAMPNFATADPNEHFGSWRSIDELYEGVVTPLVSDESSPHRRPGSPTRFPIGNGDDDVSKDGAHARQGFEVASRLEGPKNLTLGSTSDGTREARTPMAQRIEVQKGLVFPRSVFMRPDPDSPLPAPEVQVPDENSPEEPANPPPSEPPPVNSSGSDILPFLENVVLGVGFESSKQEEETSTPSAAQASAQGSFQIQAAGVPVALPQQDLIPQETSIEIPQETSTESPGVPLETTINRNGTSVRSNDSRSSGYPKDEVPTTERISDTSLLRPRPPVQAPAPDFLLTEVGLIMEPTVVTGPTGEEHLAIRFMRKADSIPASFLFLASKDLRDWNSDAELFFLADVRRSTDGRQEVTIGLTESVDESAYRYMRIRVKRL